MIFISVATGGGGGDSSASGLHMSQETPPFVRRGGGTDELRPAAQPGRLAVSGRAEQLRQAGGGEAAETVPAMSHHGVAAEQAGGRPG